MYINRVRLEYQRYMYAIPRPLFQYSHLCSHLSTSSLSPSPLLILFCSSLPSLRLPLSPFPRVDSIPLLSPYFPSATLSLSVFLSLSLFPSSSLPLFSLVASPSALFSLRFLRSYSIPSNRNQTSSGGGSETRMRQGI